MTILDVIMRFSKYFCLTFLRCTSEFIFCLFFNYTEQNGTAVPNWKKNMFFWTGLTLIELYIIWLCQLDHLFSFLPLREQVPWTPFTSLPHLLLWKIKKSIWRWFSGRAKWERSPISGGLGITLRWGLTKKWQLVHRLKSALEKIQFCLNQLETEINKIKSCDKSC